MTENNITERNHYVSQGYLKNWESSPGNIMVYRVLVSHEDVPLWRETSIKGVGYYNHLYTLKVTDSENDDLEKWFSSEFESPAENAIQKVINERCLSPNDWRMLVRFLAMHDVRTPARLAEHLEKAPESTSRALEKTLSDLPAKLQAIQRCEIEPPSYIEQNSCFPLKITKKISEDDEFGTVMLETAIGRASWLWGVQRLLNSTAMILHQHRWTIMHPAKGMSWFTTDNPVVRLNFHGLEKYDFKGGWASKGTEIFMPLSPEHMLYTQVGDRPPLRGSRFSIEHTKLIRRLIAENAHRFIFSRSKEEEVNVFRTRKVDAEMFKYEQAQWKNFHSEQIESEQHFFSGRR